MSDIAQILGVAQSSFARNDDHLDIPTMMMTTASNKKIPRAVKLQQLPKDVLDLLAGGSSNNETGSMELPPAIPSINVFTKKENKATNVATTKSLPGETVVKVGNKWISTSKPVRSWKWSSFTSSARNDGLQLNHWVRSNVEYLDYPYARFNITLDALTYDTNNTTSDNTNNINEYRALQLHTDPNWSKSETDLLLELAKRYELRWPVIYDRWLETFGNDTNINDSSNGNRFQIEDLQHRYYTVAAVINQRRVTSEAKYEAHSLAFQTNAASVALANANNKVNPNNNTTSTSTPSTGASSAAGTSSENAENEITKQRTVESLLIETAAARSLATTEPQYQPMIQNVATGTSNKIVFDLQKERQRRSHMESLWNRSKADEIEELELRKELKQIDVQLRKLKKSGTHIIAAAAANNNYIHSGTGSKSRGASRATTPIQFGGSGPKETLVDPTTIPTMLDHAFATTTAGPIATAGIPYIQSCRLLPPGVGDGSTISPALLSRMDSVLDELNISQNPIPTKRVCDVYDTLRRDILTLLILQKNVLLKEGILTAKHLRLAKKSGNSHVDDEETLLGIPPPKPSTPSIRSSSSATAAAAASGGGKGSRNTKSVKTDGTSKKKSTLTQRAGVSVATVDVKKDEGRTMSKAGTVTTAISSGGKQPRKPTAPGGVKRKRKSDDSGLKAVVSGIASVPPAATAIGAIAAPISSSIPVHTTTTIHPGTITGLAGKPITATPLKAISSLAVPMADGTLPNAPPSAVTLGNTVTAALTTTAITTTPTTGSTTDSKASAKKRIKKSA